MSIRKRLLTGTLLAAMMALVLAVGAQAETLRPKVDNFILFVDYSGSMAMTSDSLNSVKIKHAKELIERMNAEIPALGYKSSVATFAPYSQLSAPATYNKAAVSKAASAIKTDYDIYGRNTPMGIGLKDLDPTLAQFSGKTALIIFTDGDSNYGAAPVAEAKALYAKYPNVCIHVCPTPTTPAARAVVDGVRAISTAPWWATPRPLATPPPSRSTSRTCSMRWFPTPPSPAPSSP
jgi:OOP family OmpA-OmpF porin